MEYQTQTSKTFDSSPYQQFCYRVLTCVVPGDKVTIDVDGSMGKRRLISKCHQIIEDDGTSFVTEIFENGKLVLLVYTIDGQEIVKEV